MVKKAVTCCKSREMHFTRNQSSLICSRDLLSNYIIETKFCINNKILEQVSYEKKKDLNIIQRLHQNPSYHKPNCQIIISLKTYKNFKVYKAKPALPQSQAF
jgi:hypothetical protein